MVEPRTDVATPVSTDADFGSQLARGSVAGLVTRVGGYLSQYLFQVSIARVLGATTAGTFFTCAALANVAAVTGRGGLDRTGLRAISKMAAEGRRADAYATAMRLLAIVLALSAVLAIGLWLFRDQVAAMFDAAGQATGVGLVLLAIPGLAVSFTCAEFLRATKRILLGGFVQLILVYTAGIGALWAMRWLIGGSLSIAGATFAAVTLTAATVGMVVVRSVLRPRPGVRGTPPPDMASGAVFMLWTSLLILWLGTVDVLFMGLFQPGEQTAFYVAAARTAMLPSIGLVAVNSIVVPLIAAEHRVGHPERTEELVRMGARWGLVIAVLAVGGLVVSGPPFLSLFGETFRQAHPLLLVLVLGQLVNSGAGAVAQLMLMTGYERRAAAVLTAVVLLVVPAYAFTIPRYGAMGAAVTTSVGVTLWNIGLILQARRCLRVTSVADNAVRVGVFLLAVAAAAYLAGGAGRVALIVSYVLVSPWVGWMILLNTEDRRVLRSLVRGGKGSRVE